MKRTSVLGLGAALMLSACAAPSVPLLSRAQLAPDFETYELRRVALLMPFAPRDAEAARSDALSDLQDDLVAYLSTGTPYEIVEIGPADLGELRLDQPTRDGRLSIDSLLGLAERFGVDAVLYTQVTHERLHPPLAIGLQAELVSVDTGLLIWTAGVSLDGGDEPTREALRAFHQLESGDPGIDSWKVSLVSPRRFARFAAWQLAQLL